VANVYYDEHANLELLKSKRIAVLGYGSQGHAHALNMKDSGLDVVVGLRPGGHSWDQAQKDGLQVLPIPEAVKQAEVVVVLLPDHVQPALFAEQVLPNLHEGDALGFAHGFNVHYNQIQPPQNVDVFMVAPKSPGHLLRRMYVQGAGVPGLLAVYQDYTGKARVTGLAYAKAIGCTRAGVIETTFKEETETDLFGEQAVLCGGTAALIKAGFETLVEAGYQPEIAYYECLNELKLIVDLIYEGGLTWMRQSVSDTAAYGDLTRGGYIVTEETRNQMRKILREVQSGEFAREWILENQANRPVFTALARADEEHLLEKVGRQLRGMMPWLKGQ